MRDLFYKFVCELCRPPFVRSWTATFLNEQRIDRKRPGIIAPNHVSPYDIPAVMGTLEYPACWVSTVDVMRRPDIWLLFSLMNAIALRRGERDIASSRKILRQLERARLVVIFPEARIPTPEKSMLCGGSFNPSFLRLAQLSGAPIYPMVVLGTGAYSHFKAWLPVHRTRVGTNTGEAIYVGPGREGLKAAKTQIMQEYQQLYTELSEVTGLTIHSSAWRGAQ